MTPADPPLARLFAIAYRELVEKLHERLRDRGWSDVRPAFGFVLLAVREEPATLTDLAALMGTTKQAASKLVDAMAAAGYVERLRVVDDGRRRPVGLTGRGRRLLAAVEEIYAELEQEWAAVLGPGGLERLRQDLVRALTDDGTAVLPPVRPVV